MNLMYGGKKSKLIAHKNVFIDFLVIAEGMHGMAELG